MEKRVKKMIKTLEGVVTVFMRERKFVLNLFDIYSTIIEIKSPIRIQLTYRSVRRCLVSMFGTVSKNTLVIRPVTLHYLVRKYNPMVKSSILDEFLKKFINHEDLIPKHGDDISNPEANKLQSITSERKE